MAFLTSVAVGAVIKAIGLFGGQALETAERGYLKKLEIESNQDSQFTQMMVEGLRSENERRRIVADERKSLIGTHVYSALVALCVAPPAVYLAAIYFVSTFSFLGWSVDRAPATEHEAALEIVKWFAVLVGVARRRFLPRASSLSDEVAKGLARDSRVIVLAIGAFVGGGALMIFIEWLAG